MKLLLVGSSSFTACWIIQDLVGAGHEVVATFASARQVYQDVRAERVARITAIAPVEFEAPLGSERLRRIVQSVRSDVFCHHVAMVTNYKSRDFDFAGALVSNTRGLGALLDDFAGAGGQRVIATGSVFESDEGAGEHPLRAFSPYGLSKALTWQAIRYLCEEKRLPLAKFVISNPFGVLEEPRFTTYLARSWMAGETPSVATPRYVRDNIHVGLLARAYRLLVDRPQLARIAPSGYVESQGAFASRMAAEMEPRLGRPCPVRFATQTEFPEPRVRINTDVLDPVDIPFDESQAWDNLAAYYRDGRVPRSR